MNPVYRMKFKVVKVTNDFVLRGIISDLCLGDIRFICRPGYCLSLRMFRRICLHLPEDADNVLYVELGLHFYLIIRKIRNILHSVKRNIVSKQFFLISLTTCFGFLIGPP